MDQDADNADYPTGRTTRRVCPAIGKVHPGLDDAYALVMLIGVWITTPAVASEHREDYVTHALTLAGRPDVQSEARGRFSLTNLRVVDPMVCVSRRPSSSRVGFKRRDCGIGLHDCGIAARATVVAIGQFADLKLPEATRRGGLGHALANEDVLVSALHRLKMRSDRDMYCQRPLDGKRTPRQLSLTGRLGAYARGKIFD